MRRALFAIPVVAAGLLLAGCGDDTPKCTAPLVAVDHGHTASYLMPIMVGKHMSVIPATRWVSDWRCEEAATR